MAKIVILTSTADRHDYFAAMIASHFQEDNVSIIREAKSSRGRAKSILSKFLSSKHKFILLRNLCLDLIFRKYKKMVTAEKNREEKKFFSALSNDQKQLLKSKLVTTVSGGKTINDHEYVETIRNLQPDIIVVMGTSLIKNEIIGIPKYGILNIHTGLSPYYRGGMTNFWPFIHAEIGCCGVTVHTLDIGIDSGAIIYHGIPNIDKDDNYSSINCKSIVAGTELMIRAIDDLKNNRLHAIPQWDTGNLFYNRDYNGYYAFQYIRTYRKAIHAFLADRQYPKRLILTDPND